MNGSERLGRIQERAHELKHDAKHHAHEKHEAEKEAGIEAVRRDFPRIVQAIEKRMDRRFLGSRQLGAHIAKQGDGQYTWVMPNDFKLSVRHPYHTRFTFNPHGFTEAYVKELQKQLGEEFFVMAQGHAPDGKLVVSWAPKPSSHGH